MVSPNNYTSNADDSNGPLISESSQTSVPFTNEDLQLKSDVDGSPSTSWQENLSGTGLPTTTVDTTTITTTSASPKASSLNIEHFDLDEQVSTPIALDIPPAPFSNSFSDITQPSNSSNETNGARRPFKLPASKTSAKTKKRRKSLNVTVDSIMDDSFVDMPSSGGYTPASSKRNAEFHALFRSVPEEDFLINDYGCALQREILVQGRIYVSCNHVCFNANIFGWVTNLVIAFSDIVSIEKKVTAFVIPNAIQISTLHARHFFTSFLARDTAFELLNVIWKQTHPALNQKPSFNESEYTPNKSSEASDASSESSEMSDEGEKNSIGCHMRDYKI